MIYLVDGLPDFLVIEEILPRIPWYVRPVCRSASKLWKTTIDADVNDDLTKSHQLPLLQDSLVLVSTPVDARRVVSIKNAQGQIQLLPPVNLFPGTPKVVCWEGIVCVWTVADDYCWRSDRDLIFQLNIGAGKWKWQTFPVMFISAWLAVNPYRNRIYAGTTVGLDSRDPEARYTDRVTSCEPPQGVTVRYDIFWQTYNVVTATCTVTRPQRISVLGEGWDDLNPGTGKLLAIAVLKNSDRLVTWHAKGVRKIVKGAIFPPDGFYSQYPRYIRGDSFIPPMTQGFTIVILWKQSRDPGYRFKWCNTHTAPYWSTIPDVESGLLQSSSSRRVKGVTVVDGRIYALCRDKMSEQDDPKKLKWLLFHGVVDWLHNSLVWQVLLESKILFECLAPMRRRR